VLLRRLAAEPLRSAATTSLSDTHDILWTPRRCKARSTTPGADCDRHLSLLVSDLARLGSDLGTYSSPKAASINEARLVRSSS
jgi:hypothetical protein